MKSVVFLESAVEDLEWFRKYYREVFPAGMENAATYMREAIGLLREFPKSGTVNEALENCRDFRVTRTPFVLVFRETAYQVEILHVKDARSLRPY